MTKRERIGQVLDTRAGEDIMASHGMSCENCGTTIGEHGIHVEDNGLIFCGVPCNLEYAGAKKTNEIVYLGVPCQYSVSCTNPASTTITIPILGGVDSCQDCLELYVRLTAGNSGTH